MIYGAVFTRQEHEIDGGGECIRTSDLSWILDEQWLMDAQVLR